MYELMLKKGSFFSSKLLSRRKKCVKIKDGNAFRMDKTKYDRFSFFCSKVFCFAEKAFVPVILNKRFVLHAAEVAVCSSENTPRIARSPDAARAVCYFTGGNMQSDQTARYFFVHEVILCLFSYMRSY